MKGLHPPGREKHPAETSRLAVIEVLAAENVYERAVLRLVKMEGDRRSLNKLHRRVALERPFGETFDECFAVALHTDLLA